MKICPKCGKKLHWYESLLNGRYLCSNCYFTVSYPARTHSFRRISVG